LAFQSFDVRDVGWGGPEPGQLGLAQISSWGNRGEDTAQSLSSLGAAGLWWAVSFFFHSSDTAFLMEKSHFALGNVSGTF